MTFLPIVARELRVASRRRWTYWGRFSACLLALIVAGVVLLADDSSSQNEIGTDLFVTLAILVYFYVAIVGVQLTCDCVSTERREGTLGLLFLTDLRGYDVVFGKLAATSLHAFYSILSLLPVLAVPLLLGGVNHAEVWRVALVSANLLFFFLSVGLFSSSVCREDQRALALSAFLALATLLAAPLLHSWLTLRNPLFHSDLIWLPCPAFGCVAAFDDLYKLKGWPAFFWCNAIITQVYAWIYLLLACRIVPRSWHEPTAGPRRGKWRDRWRAFSRGSAAARAATRRKLLAINPFLWRAAFSNVKYGSPWVFLAFATAGWFVCAKLARNQYRFEEPFDLMCMAAVHFVLKIWVASEAGRSFAEDRRSGALELLLTTPLRAEEILQGQCKALWRQFATPVTVVLLVDLLFLMGALSHTNGRDDRQVILYFYLVTGVFFLADMYAMIWLSIRLGLSGRKPIRIIMLSFWWAVLLPGLVSVGITIVCEMRDIDPAPAGAALIWTIPSLTADLIVLAIAKANILNRFREGVLERARTFRPAPSPAKSS